ncbi:MAG TPA: hypothetical protein VHW23_34285 [Kofleriaceae bacterium]|jgi:hypothetical protein|nr:hypothetical protein [Kofleriaceae bacterium]
MMLADVALDLARPSRRWLLLLSLLGHALVIASVVVVQMSASASTSASAPDLQDLGGGGRYCVLQALLRGAARARPADVLQAFARALARVANVAVPRRSVRHMEAGIGQVPVAIP